jgi:hypothetical protein
VAAGGVEEGGARRVRGISVIARGGAAGVGSGLQRRRGGIGRRARLKIAFRKECGFETLRR